MSSEHLDQEVVSIVRDWKNQAKRVQYKQRLQELGPSAIETLLALAHEEKQRYNKRAFIGIGLFLLAAGIMFLKIALRKAGAPFWVQEFFWLLRMGCSLGGISLCFSRTRIMAQILADFDDIRIVGPLVEAWNDTEARPAITEALTRLLPKMKATDAHLLNASQRKSLNSILEGKDDTIKIVVLKALQQIGDGAAIPYVKQLAFPLKGIFVAPPILVQMAAKDCLPFLTLRAEQEEQSATLLRAAGTTEISSGEMLRPAAATADPDTNTLLRATQAIIGE